MEIGRRYAEIIHKQYEEGNHMAYFALLWGIGNCKLELKEGSGHNIAEVIDGIHEYYDSRRKAGKAAVAEGYQEGLEKCVELSLTIEDTETTIAILSYELKYEKARPKTFKVNADALFEGLKQKVQERYQAFVSEKGQAFADTFLQDRNDFLSSHYGYRIL